MNKLKLMMAAVSSASIALTPVVGFATSGVDGSTSTSTTTTPAVNSSANNAASANKSAQALNYVMSAAEFAVAAKNWSECSSNNYGACVTAAIFTAYGIQSLKQAKENGNKAAQAYNTAYSSDAYGTGSYDGTTTTGTDSTDYAAADSVGSTYMKKAEAGLSQLKSAGIVNSTATKITSPDGKTYKTSDMSSAASMAAAGIPQGAIDAAQSASDKIAQKALEKVKIGALTKVSGYDESGAGGGGGSRSPSNSDHGPGYPGYAGAAARSASLLDKDPSKLVSGMSKNYNGEPIGVAADSIFLMMSRRYKVKESQDSFFGASDIDLKK